MQENGKFVEVIDDLQPSIPADHRLVAMVCGTDLVRTEDITLKEQFEEIWRQFKGGNQLQIYVLRNQYAQSSKIQNGFGFCKCYWCPVDGRCYAF